MTQAISTNKATTIQPMWLTILRVALGFILIWKGINFIRNTAILESMVEQTGVGVFSQNSSTLALVVTILTLLCGFFITVGLFTKLSCIVQLPIVFVALFFVNMKNIESNSFEMVLGIVVIFLLILFVIKGSSTLSADEYFRRGAAADRNEGS